MKAWVLHGVGDIRYEEVSCPQPADEEVLVKVRAAGICGSDIPRVYDTGAHTHPLIIGHEFSGQVTGTGKASDIDLSGRRVGVFPLIPCGRCVPCSNGLYEMCRSYNYLGSRCDGAFAEYVAVPKRNLIELPDEVSYEEAAMLEPMSVAVHAIQRGTDNYSLGRDVVIGVSGLGTIGMLIVMFLMDAGYNNIFVIGNKQSQETMAESLGISIDHYIDCKKDDASALFNGNTGGAELFFECVGTTESISCAIDSSAPAGKVVIVGNPHSDIFLDRNVYWKILRNQLRLIGTWNSTFNGRQDDDWHYVIDRLKSHSISPAVLITHRLKLEELDNGLNIMHYKTENYCKIMVIL